MRHAYALHWSFELTQFLPETRLPPLARQFIAIGELQFRPFVPEAVSRVAERYILPSKIYLQEKVKINLLIFL